MSNTGNNTSWFASGIDNSRMRIDAQEIRNLLRGVGNSAEAESSRIDSAFKKAGAAVAGYFTINSVQSFIRQIVQVRGEIESLEISFQTLLGSKTKADELFSSIRKFATETPLELAPLAKGAQTLLGFNIEAEKVMPILKQIGDISMGNADRFNSLVLAFSQMSSVGKLMGQDLLQMINAGFNPLQEMSIRTGKSISELKEQMSAGAITSEQVAAAFASAAGEGGKFYGMLEKQSKGIQGSISNLNGAIDDMLNDLGTKSQGIITSAISGATIIVENYEKIGSAIADIVVAYGAYKAALITLNTVQAIQTQMRVAHIALVRQEIAANAGATAAEIRTIVAKKSLTGALIQQTAAQIKANLVALANPYVLVAAAVAALAFGIYKLVTAETAAEAAQRKHNEAMQAAKEKKENLISSGNQLIDIINSETTTIYEQIKAWNELKESLPKGVSYEQFKAMSPKEQQKMLLEEADKRETENINKTVDDAKKQIDELKKKIEDAVKAHDSNSLLYYGSSLEAAEELLRLKEAEKKKNDELAEQVRFQSLSNEDKKKELQAQIDLIQQQIDETEKLIPESARVADSIENFVTPAIENTQKGIFDVNTEWGKFDLQTQNNIAKVNFLNGKLVETKNIMLAIDDANQNGLTYAQAISKAKEEYDSANKYLNDIKKNGDKYSDDAYKKAVEDLEKKKKSYQELGGEINIPKSDGAGIRKSNDERLRAEKDFADSILDIQNYINDKRVELLQEGIQKEKEEIEKGYRDELERINKLRDKAISEYNEKNSLKGNKAITSNNYKEEIPELSKGIEDAAAMAMAKKINKLSELNRQAIEEVQQVIDETDEIFKSNLENQTAQINKAYEKRKKIIIKNVEDIEEQTRLLASLEEKREKETAIVTIENSLKSLDVKKDIELKKQELINKTFLFQADREKALLEIEKNSKTTRLELLQELKEKGIQGLEDEIELLKVEIQGLNNELEKTPTKKIQEALKGISSIANAFSGLDGEIGEVFSSLGSAVDSISASFENAKSETKDYYGSISTAISGIVDIINMVSAASAKRKQVEKEFYQNQIALAHEYALAINETLLAQSQGTGFVTDYAGQINDAFASMTDATDNYHKALEKLNDGKAKIDLKNAIDWGNVGKGAASGAIAGAAIGSIVPVIGTAVGAVVGGIVGGLVGLFGGKKKKNVMDGLLEVFPELVDSAGNLNKELAQTLINTNQVDDSTKQLIQNAIDWADAVEAANEQIKGIVVDLAGDLGGNIRNALVDAWKAGEDASKRMFEAASESLGKFVQDLVYSAIFSDIFKQFEDDLTASLNPETGDQDVVDDYDRLMNALDGRDEFYLATMEAINKRAAERGLDFKNTEEESTQQSSRGGFETMSQDKAEEMVGRLTGMHITGIESLEEVRLIGIGVEEIRKFNLISAEKLTEMRDIALTSTDYLGKITKNTNELYEMNDRLGKIENHLRKL